MHRHQFVSGDARTRIQAVDWANMSFAIRALKEEVQKYRRLARNVGDERTAKMLEQMARDLERKIKSMETGEGGG